MTRVFQDSVAHYVTATVPTKYQAQNSTVDVNATANPRGGPAIVFGQGRWVQRTLGVSHATIILAMRAAIGGSTANVTRIVDLHEVVTLHCGLVRNADNSIQVHCNTTLIGVASAADVADSAWHWWSMKFVIHDTTGSVEVKRDGVTVLNQTGLDTRNAGTGVCDRVTFGRITNSSAYTVNCCDILMDTGDGTAPNDHEVDQRVAYLAPSGAGNSTQWTPSAGSNYQNVDDATPDEDTTYISDNTNGDIDLYALANLPSSASSISAIQEVTRLRKDDAGSQTARSVIRTGSTDYESADIVVTDAYATTFAVRALNPNTSAAWTQSEVDGLEAGVKKQA